MKFLSLIPDLLTQTRHGTGSPCSNNPSRDLDCSWARDPELWNVAWPYISPWTKLPNTCCDQSPPSEVNCLRLSAKRKSYLWWPCDSTPQLTWTITTDWWLPVHRLAIGQNQHDLVFKNKLGYSYSLGKSNHKIWNLATETEKGPTLEWAKGVKPGHEKISEHTDVLNGQKELVGKDKNKINVQIPY